MEINLKGKTFKAGSIFMEKRHNIFKRIWYKIRGKELPYNKFELFAEGVTVYTIAGDPTLNDFAVAVPKKNYTSKECQTLTMWANEVDTTNNRDIINVINLVRSNTFKEDINEVLTSKFYTIEKW